MRPALLALALCAPSIAWAASINTDLGMGCRELDYQKRIAAAAGARDRAGRVALIEQGLATGQCQKIPKGTRVRVEETSFPYACVARFGTAERCQWVTQREVDAGD